MRTCVIAAQVALSDLNKPQLSRPEKENVMCIDFSQAGESGNWLSKMGMGLTCLNHPVANRARPMNIGILSAVYLGA